MLGQLGIIGDTLKILGVVFKDPKLAILVPIAVGLGYVMYEINHIKEVTNDGKFIDINDNENWKKFYNMVMEDIFEKQRLAKRLVEICDNQSPGSCYTSYWYTKITEYKVTATNYFVVSCNFTYEGKQYECGKIINEKYTKVLEIPKGFYDLARNSYTSCASGKWDDIVNMKGSNFAEYNNILDIELNMINLCSYDDKIIILTQKKGHDAKRIGENENIGCIDSSCLYETIDMMSEYRKEHIKDETN